MGQKRKGRGRGRGRGADPRAPSSASRAPPREGPAAIAHAAPGSDAGLAKVALAPVLEERLLAVLLEHHPVSHVAEQVVGSEVKLRGAYDALVATGLPCDWVERAMRATGGRLDASLDFCCLHMPHNQLPKGFSDKVYAGDAGDITIAPRNSRPVVADTTRVPDSDATADASEDPAVTVSPPHDTRTAEPSQHVKESLPLQPPDAQANQKKDDADKANIAWILRYSEGLESDDEVHSEATVVVDPTEEYYATALQIEDIVESAAAAKATGDKAAQRGLGQQISAAKQRLSALESEVGVDIGAAKARVEETLAARKALQTCDAPSNAISTVPADPHSGPLPEESITAGSKDSDSDSDTGCDLSIFETEVGDESAEPNAEKAVSDEHPQVKDWPRSYATSGWTGKTPRDLLGDVTRKLFKGAKAPTFQKSGQRGSFRCSVSIHRTGKTASVPLKLSTPESIPLETVAEAQGLAATIALHAIASDQPLHLRLPPPFRAVWNFYQSADIDKTASLHADTVARRNAFCSELLARLDISQTTQSVSPPLKPQQETPKPTDKEFVKPKEVESWEDDESADDDESYSSLDNFQPPANIGHVAQVHSAHRYEPDADPRLLRLLEIGRKRVEKSHGSSRRDLPVYKEREQLLSLVRDNPVVIVSGDTGCGKTTQVPQFLLEAGLESGPCNVVCTQPRRISAISIASRVSEEMGHPTPGNPGTLVGYQVRLERAISATTCLTYCTTGILLRRLQSDPKLRSVTHVIIDEVHERSLDTDFLMLLLRRTLRSTRRDLKLILMSATMDAAKVSAYYGGAPTLIVPGRTFPVEIKYIEDAVEETGYVLDPESPYRVSYDSDDDSGRPKPSSDKLDHGVAGELYSSDTLTAVQDMDDTKINLDLIERLILSRGWDVSGSTLVFLPGMGDIMALHTQLLSNPEVYESDRFLIVALHSTISAKEQAAAFVTPRSGCHKVVISTNIAETGITIPDCTLVIDSCMVKEVRFQTAGRIRRLVQDFCCKAAAKQRAGRAGRVQAGVCYRLVSRNRYRRLPAETLPEIRRVPLESTVLHILASSLGGPSISSDPLEILAEALDPPDPSTVHSALQELVEVGAVHFNDDEKRSELTPLGWHLSKLPVDARLGKIMIYGALFGIPDAACTVAASVGYKSPFVSPIGNRDAAQRARVALGGTESDLLAILFAFRRWLKERKSPSGAARFCRSNFLDNSTLETLNGMRLEFTSLLKTVGFSISDRHSGDGCARLLRAAITAGLYPNVARGTPGKVELSFHRAPPAMIHPSSVVKNLMKKRPQFAEKELWAVFGHRMRTSQLFVHDVTVVSPKLLLLFGGPLTVRHQDGIVAVDNWIRVRASAKTAVLFKTCRAALDGVLREFIRDPSGSVEGSALLQIIVSIIVDPE